MAAGVVTVRAEVLILMIILQITTCLNTRPGSPEITAPCAGGFPGEQRLVVQAGEEREASEPGAGFCSTADVYLYFSDMWAHVLDNRLRCIEGMQGSVNKGVTKAELSRNPG